MGGGGEYPHLGRGTPHQLDGLPPVQTWEGGTPPPISWMGYPPHHPDLGRGYPSSAGWAPPPQGVPSPAWGTPPPIPDQHSVHLLRGGRYASCVYTRGLSCLRFILNILNAIIILILYNLDTIPLFKSLFEQFRVGC